MRTTFSASIPSEAVNGAKPPNASKHNAYKGDPPSHQSIICLLDTAHAGLQGLTAVRQFIISDLRVAQGFADCDILLSSMVKGGNVFESLQ